MPGQWQLRFDNGHQQRYLPDRQSVLRYVLAIGVSSASTRFEVFAEAPPIRLADGSPGGRAFTLTEVIDLARPGEAERVQAELAAFPRPAAARPGGQAAAGTGSASTGSASTGSASTGSASMGSAVPALRAPGGWREEPA